MTKPKEQLDTVVIRFAGDSGEGMQLTGTRFAEESGVAGSDLATWPDYPAEIRAPAGTIAGVSGFQIHFGSVEIYTAGDRPNVLVAMNPAALKANVKDLEAGGILIVDQESFTSLNLQKAEYAENPLEDGSLSDFQVFPIEISTLTKRAVAEAGLQRRAALRSRNFFCLGVVSWLFTRPIEPTLEWIEKKFKDLQMADANTRALKAGYNFANTTEIFATNYEVRPATVAPGTYRNASGTEALSLGLVAATERTGQPIFFGSYPITPASDLLHWLSRCKAQGVTTFQAEDEIAAVGSALGAAFGGAIGVTATSGPGLDLKAEMIGLGVMVELPLIIIDVQRAGPSTGLPTKTSQGDLMMALYGRHGECPLPVLAPATVAECFTMAYEAVRIAVKYMTPVILLSDATLANGAEPWRLPDVADLPEIPLTFRTEAEGFLPYARDPETLARPWVVPGTPGLEHRIGGLEKADQTGAVCYEPENHETMVGLRAAKIAGVAREIPPSEVFGPKTGDTLVVGWGSTYGSIRAAVEALQAQGHSVAHVHLRHLNPLPADLATICAQYQHVVVPELNDGQLSKVLSSSHLPGPASTASVRGAQAGKLADEARQAAREFDSARSASELAPAGSAGGGGRREPPMINAIPICKVQGRPFHISELVERIAGVVKEVAA